MIRRIVISVIVIAIGASVLAIGVAAGDSGDYRIRAIFDNANQVTVGEQVRVAGVTVGVIQALDVTDDNKAAVTLRIDNPAYQDFRSDARCIIRPQSLIGEQFVDCSPTEPKPAGTPQAPGLVRIPSGPGEGDLLLPVTRTSSPVGIDLIGNIMRVPQRQRFALILNEFGTALAGNGQALNDVIRRANPALQETDRVLETLGNQNRVLANLATESDQVLGPLARDRKEIQQFINSSNATGEATAAKGAELEANFERFPAFLSGLTSTMGNLNSFSRNFAGFLQPLSGANVAQLNSIVSQLPAFSTSSTAAFETLGATADAGNATLTAGAPTIGRIRDLANRIVPVSANLGSLFGSLKVTGAWEFLMQVVYFASGNSNGFNQYGHYGRVEAITNPGSCETPQAVRVDDYPSCSANFDGGSLGSGASIAARRALVGRKGALKPLADQLTGLAGMPGIATDPVRPKAPTNKSVPTPPVATPNGSGPASPAQGGTTTQASPGAGSGAVKANSAAMLQYLIGGSGR